MSVHRPSILIVATKWWPLSARLAMALIDHGCQVSALCPPHHPLTCVSRLQSVHHCSGVRSLAVLRACLARVRPDVVVPGDDGVVAQLHALHESDASLRPLIETSLGAPSGYHVVASRHRLLHTARELGIATPETRVMRRVGDLSAWHMDHPSGVLKSDGECGGNGVRICHSLRDSLAAWRELTAPRTLPIAIKRLLIDRDSLSLWSRGQQAARQICMQALVRGRPANTMFVSLRGRLVAQVSVVVLAADGPTGAAMIVRTTENAQMAQAAQRLAEHLELSGFYGLDFMIEADSGNAQLIEMNPRCTQLGHLDLPDRGSLAGAFTAALQGRRVYAPLPRHTSETTAVAFFPQALLALSASGSESFAELRSCDAPSQEPVLLKELMQAPWPQRHWLARLYHLARPPARATAVLFDEAGNAQPLSSRSLALNLPFGDRNQTCSLPLPTAEAPELAPVSAHFASTLGP